MHVLDEHGATVPYLGEFVVCGNRTFDARIVWCMASLVTSVPLLSEKISESVSHFNDWQAWFLTFVPSKCLAGEGASGLSRKVFCVRSVTDVVSALHPKHNVEGYNTDRIGSTLRSLDGVHVLYGRKRSCLFEICRQ